MTQTDSQQVKKAVANAWKNLSPEQKLVLQEQDAIWALVTALFESIWYNPDTGDLMVCSMTRAMGIAAIIYGNIGLDMTANEIYRGIKRKHDTTEGIPIMYNDRVYKIFADLGYFTLPEYRAQWGVVQP